MTTTETHTQPCGCTHTTTYDDCGQILYIDEGICGHHTARIWETLDTNTPHTRFINPHTVEIKDTRKELTHEQ